MGLLLPGSREWRLSVRGAESLTVALHMALELFAMMQESTEVSTKSEEKLLFSEYDLGTDIS